MCVCVCVGCVYVLCLHVCIAIPEYVCAACVCSCMFSMYDLTKAMILVLCHVRTASSEARKGVGSGAGVTDTCEPTNMSTRI